MTLQEFMKAAGLTDEAMAQKLQCSQTAVTRYRNHDRMPRPEVMQLIERVTEGKVTANDFVAGVVAKGTANRTELNQAS